MIMNAFTTAPYLANQFEGFIIDPTPPIITITSPTAGQTTLAGEPVDFIFDAQDAETGISLLDAVVDGGYSIYSGQTIDDLDIGTHIFMVSATNGQGMQSSSDVVFHVSSATPSCLWSDCTTGPLADETDGHGVAWGDYDNDGDDDLFLANFGYNVLLRNDGGGSFTKMPEHPGGAGSSDSRGAAWEDYNNDGWLDLYVVNYDRQNYLYRNDHGVLVDVTTGPLGCTEKGNNAAWADYDLDGDLDLFFTNYDGPNKLLRNDDGVFVLVTGTPVAFTDHSRGCAWGDYDMDNDPDLYVSVGNAPNRLFRNDLAGGFVDVTTAPLDDDGYGKGVAWGDYDNDGDLDLYLVNRNSPNRLFRNDRGSGFTNVADNVIGDDGDGRGCGWGDYNNDGWLDLFITNYSGGNKLFHNLGGTSFADTTCGALHADLTAWGMGWSDYDNDGDLDLYVSNHTYSGIPNRMFCNDLVSKNWLRVDLVGNESNRSGIGAKITVVSESRSQMREVSAGAGYMSQSSSAAFFGFESSAPVDITIHWPSGLVQQIRDQEINQRLVIVEDSSLSAVTEQNRPTTFEVSNHPNPFNPYTHIEFSLPKAASVTLRIYDVSGQIVRTLLVDARYPLGRHSITWQGKDNGGRSVASGVYFYRLEAGQYSHTGRMVMLK